MLNSNCKELAEIVCKLSSNFDHCGKRKQKLKDSGDYVVNGQVLVN